MKTMLNSKSERMTSMDGETGLGNQGFTAVSLPAAPQGDKPSVGGQMETNKTKLMKLKYKIILAVVLGLGCIVGAVIVTYLGLFYWRNEQGTTQIFHMVLHDKWVGSDAIHLDITVSPEDQGKMAVAIRRKRDPFDLRCTLEYSRSPQEGVDARSSVILGLKDFKRGIVAYKEDNGSQCFISKIVTNSLLHTLANGTVQEANVEENETYVELNQTIHPFVLRLAAGDNIVDFCGDRDAIWMIPVKEFGAKIEEGDENEHGRERRWLCWGWGCGRYRRCWWNCTWWGWKKFCSRRCYY